MEGSQKRSGGVSKCVVSHKTIREGFKLKTQTASKIFIATSTVGLESRVHSVFVHVTLIVILGEEI